MKSEVHRIRVRGSTIEGEVIRVFTKNEGRLGGNTVYYEVRLDNGSTMTYMRDEVKIVK